MLHDTVKSGIDNVLRVFLNVYSFHLIKCINKFYLEMEQIWFALKMPNFTWQWKKHIFDPLANVFVLLIDLNTTVI